MLFMHPPRGTRTSSPSTSLLLLLGGHVFWHLESHTGCLASSYAAIIVRWLTKIVYVSRFPPPKRAYFCYFGMIWFDLDFRCIARYICQRSFVCRESVRATFLRLRLSTRSIVSLSLSLSLSPISIENDRSIKFLITYE